MSLIEKLKRIEGMEIKFITAEHLLFLEGCKLQ